MLVTADPPMCRFCPNSLPVAAVVVALIVLLCSFACGDQGENERAGADSIRADRLAAQTRFLSSDALEGRGIGGRAETVTTEYIAAQFELSGALPAGDSGTFFQSVPLVGVKTQPSASLSWASSGARSRLKYLDDFVAVNHRQEPLAMVEAQAVYVGHGIVAPEFAWDDYKGVDVKGKVVILFTNEPASDDADFFGGRALTYYGRWTFKYEEVLRQGAAGCLIIHTTPTAGYPWEVVRNSWSGREPFVKLAPGEDALALAGWVHADAAESMLAATGKSLDELLAMSQARDFQPIPLSIRLKARLASDVEPINTRNVVGMIEGSDIRDKDEAVIYTAHWDHLGVGVAVDGDGIYNGAVDNATGLALLLELARAFGELAQRPPAFDPLRRRRRRGRGFAGLGVLRPSSLRPGGQDGCEHQLRRPGATWTHQRHHAARLRAHDATPHH